jgi:hypothetical protein
MRPIYGMGRTQGLSRAFKKYPLGFPLFLIVFGGGLLWLTLESKSRFAIAAAFLIIIVAMGVITLPFGIAITARRVFFPAILRCPYCGTEARTATRPFKVEYPPAVDYAYVICSSCGRDFTANKLHGLK